MSKIHVLSRNGDGYQVYIHTAMPIGVNLVSNSWSACYVAAFSPSTQMSVGTGLGQITSSEAAAVLAGAEIEFQGSVSANADGSAPSSGQINTYADNIIAAGFLSLQSQLKYYGYTQ